MGTCSWVTESSEGTEHHSFWNLTWGKTDKSQLEQHIFVCQNVVYISMPTRPHPAWSSGSPLGSLLSSSHQSSLWESAFRSKIFSVALSHIACLVVTLFLNSILVLSGLLVHSSGLQSRAHHSCLTHWVSHILPHGLLWSLTPLLLPSISRYIQAVLVAGCTWMAVKRRAAKITPVSQGKWCSC